MKNIKLFENFDSHYLWPDSIFWLNKLEPEELCFLGLYSYMLKKDKKESLFEVEYDGTNESEPDEDGDGSLEMIFSFPVEKSESLVYISCVILFSGGFSKYYAGTYNDPPEGGEYQLRDIEIESAFYLDKDEVNEYELDNMEYKSEWIKKADMINLIKYLAEYFINYDDSGTDTVKPILPQGLKDKCEMFRKETPDLTRGAVGIHRFTRDDDED